MQLFQPLFWGYLTLLTLWSSTVNSCRYVTIAESPHTSALIGTMARLPTAKLEERYSTGRATYKPCSKDTIIQYPRSKADKTKVGNTNYKCTISCYGKVCLCDTNCHLYHKDPCPKRHHTLRTSLSCVC